MTSPESTTCPLFVLSLPRAGSTLLQRVLGAHPDIATASEPWLLLPLLYALRPEGALAEYDHASAATAITEFSRDHLASGAVGYRAEIARLAERLYSQAAHGKPFFLDKTPRYHLIASEILDMFPHSPVVFLWRHPLAVAASIIDTWGSGKWVLDVYAVDLFEGLANLTAVYEKNRSRSVAIRFEDLVTEPETAVRGLLSDLRISEVEGLTDRFLDVELTGTMGDPTGTTRYKHLSREPLTRWQPTFANPIRKAWARRYLRWIGIERLALMGYSLDDLVAELEAIPGSAKYVVSDSARSVYGDMARRTARVLIGRPRGNSIYHRGSER